MENLVIMVLKNLGYGPGSHFSITKVLFKGGPELCGYIVVFAIDIRKTPAVRMILLVLYGLDHVVRLAASKNDRQDVIPSWPGHNDGVIT